MRKRKIVEIHPVPKPAKRTASQRKPLPDGREILTAHGWAQRREEVCKAANYTCQSCERFTSLELGHAHHPQGRGLGGGKRDDRAPEWLCSVCHIEHHEAKRRA